MSPIRVLVVDDQTMVRGALATLLSLEPDIEVVGQAGDGAEALAALDALAGGTPSPIDEAGAGRPNGGNEGDAESTRASSAARVGAPATAARTVDVVLLDVEMPRMDGLTTCAAIRSRYPGVRVLMLTTFGRPGYVQRSLDAGASGFLVKDAPSEQLADAVRRIAQGLRVIDPTLAVETLERGTSPLTDREVDVLRAVADGGTIADIAAALELSQGTVRNHVSSAMLKTSARTRAEAVRVATENGWL